MRLLGTSLKRRKPCFDHTGPSVKRKPVAARSTLTSAKSWAEAVRASSKISTGAIITPSMALRTYAERYRENLLESVIPFWMKHSVDREHGGFFTCLERDGTVFDTRKYVWLQGRQVWMLSKLWNEVERREEWLEA